MAEKDNDIIDLGKLFTKLWSRRKLFFYRVWPITFVVSVFIIMCVPRYYSSSAKLAPEVESALNGGTLGQMVSAFGIDISSIQTTDAITPLLYPELLDDNGFIAKLFTIRVKSADGEIDTDYYTYLQKYQKKAWWSKLTGSIRSLFAKKKDSEATPAPEGEKSPYWLSEKDAAIAERIRSNITFNVDKQTAVITISTRAQDPLIAKTLADSVQAHLQQVITDYRTSKARIDEEHYRHLLEEARAEYEKACEDYAQATDAYKNVVLSKYQVRIDNIERDMQMKYTILQTLTSQFQLSSAKVQERTPAFTVIMGASVPHKAAGPKRMIFVAGMLFVVTLFFSFWLVRGIIFGREA